MWVEDSLGLWYEFDIIIQFSSGDTALHQIEYSRYKQTLFRMQPKPTEQLLKYLIECSVEEAHNFLLDFHNHVASGEYGHEVGKGLYAGKDAAYWTHN